MSKCTHALQETRQKSHFFIASRRRARYNMLNNLDRGTGRCISSAVVEKIQVDRTKEYVHA
jgi:hypothetical protein